MLSFDQKLWKYYVEGSTFIFLLFRYLAYHAFCLFIRKLNHNSLILLLLHCESLIIFTLVAWFELSSKMGQHWIERPVSSQKSAHYFDCWHHLIFPDHFIFGFCDPKQIRERQAPIISIQAIFLERLDQTKFTFKFSSVKARTSCRRYRGSVG